MTSLTQFSHLKVALVHDWLVGQRGGEQVLGQLCTLFANAPIFTLVHRPGSVDDRIGSHSITQSFIGKATRRSCRFRHLLPLFPAAIEAFDLRGFDVVISTSHCVAHGVRTPPGTVHLSYVHTPMRYLYDQMHHYLPKPLRPLTAPLARLATAPLRRWDRRAAMGPTALLANSAYVAERIARVWGREAEVVHPPVNIEAFVRVPQARHKKGLLWVGALVPYKRVDLCIMASAKAQVPLTIVGRGPEEARLRALAGPQVHFLGDVSQQQLQQLYASHEALIYPGEEDFGIVPVEAMAAGCPVLALGRGGLKETVRPDGPKATGVWVQQDSAQGFADGFAKLRAMRAQNLLTPEVLREHVQHFAPNVFAQKIAAALSRHLGAASLARPVGL